MIGFYDLIVGATASMLNKLRVLRMLRHILLHCRTNDVDLEIVLARPIEGRLR